MRKVGPKEAIEKQRDETPDDLSIPDFLRRPIPTTATPLREAPVVISAIAP
ncbi:MAG: hypothetical protein WCD13_19605 [Pseudolabrys sp.]